MPVYTIYLSGNPVRQAENQDAIFLNLYSGYGTHRAWEINWDKIFKGDNYKYKKCRVRTNIVTDGIAYTSGFNNGSGYLTIDTPCVTNASTTFAGCPQLLTSYDNVPTITNGTYTYCIKRNRLDNIRGMNIVPPINRGIVSFNLNQGDLLGKMTLPSGTISFQLHISFEFYN